MRVHVLSRARSAVLVGLSLLLAETTTRADALTAEQALERAEAHVAEAEFEQALDLLRAAEQLTVEPAVLARIYRDQGIVQEILKRPDDAVISFFRSVRCDGDANLSPDSHKASAVRLFSIARALAAADPEGTHLTSGTGLRLGADRVPCARSATGPPPDPAPGAHVAPPGDEGRSTLLPWLSTGVAGAAVTAGVIVLAAAASKDAECSGINEPEAYAVCDRDATNLERTAAFVAGAAIASGLGALGLWIAW